MELAHARLVSIYALHGYELTTIQEEIMIGCQVHVYKICAVISHKWSEIDRWLALNYFAHCNVQVQGNDIIENCHLSISIVQWDYTVYLSPMTSSTCDLWRKPALWKLYDRFCTTSLLIHSQLCQLHWLSPQLAQIHRSGIWSTDCVLYTDMYLSTSVPLQHTHWFSFSLVKLLCQLFCKW